MEQKDNLSPMSFDEQISTGVSEPGPNKKNILYTFDEHMWDKLPEIQQHS